MAKWYCSVLMELLEMDEESDSWKKLNIFGERGVPCDHIHVLFTYFMQRHWEWQESGTGKLHGALSYSTVYVGSLDVKTAFDVANMEIVERILTASGAHGDTVAAILVEMKDFHGIAQFGTSEAGFRYSKCIRQGSVEAPVLW